MLTKRYYTDIAKCINHELMRESCHVTITRLIEELCEMFMLDNPHFSREAFIEACWKGVV